MIYIHFKMWLKFQILIAEIVSLILNKTDATLLIKVKPTNQPNQRPT